MKKHLQVLLCLMLPLFSISQTSFEIEHINYQVTSTGDISTVEIKASPTATGAIVIPETVTHQGITYRVTAIGDWAFYYNALTSVIIPDSVTTIGAYAFYYNDLTSVTIPDSVTAIGDWAFYYNGLTSVTILDSVTTIGAYAFYDNALTSVTIPDSVTAIGGSAFSRNPLTEVIVQSAIPASIEDTSFGNRAIVYLHVPESLKQDYINSGWTGFQDHSIETFTQDNVNYVKTGETSAMVIRSPKATGAIEILKEVSFQGILCSVKAIDDSAFAGNDLTSVVIPNSITAIGNGAFISNALTSVTIPGSVTAIGDYAFAENALEKVIAKSTTPPIYSNIFSNRSDIALIIPEGTKVAYEAAGWTGFKSITLGIIAFEIDDINYQVTSTGDIPTVKIKASPNATGAIAIPETVTHEGTTYRVTAIGDGAFFGNGLTSVTIPDSVTAIGNYVFYSNDLTSVTIPDSVTAIGNYAFYNNDLTSVTIGNSVTAIGYGAFFGNALTSVTIPDSVTAIGSSAFGENPLTEVIVQSETPASIEDTSFGNRAIVYLNVPESLKEDYINSGWTGFQDQPVEMFTQDNVNYVKTGEASAIVIISPNATGAIEILKEVPFQGISCSVKAIDDSAFVYKALTSVVIPDSVISIADEAFYGNALTSVVIPDSVISIADEAFYGNALTSVTIGNSVISIGKSAFANNAALTSVVIPDSVTAIGDSAFSNNALTSVVISDSVTTIGEYAFYYNDFLDKVIAKSTTPPIYSNIFSSRSKIALIIPEGTKEAYEAAGWTGFKSITEDDEVLGTIDKDLNTSVHLILKDSYLKIQSTQANLKAYAIYNILGVNILKGTANKVAIDRLSSGMYIAVLSFDKGTMSKKFIIE
ncbi:leucine-rich repeat protein [Flavivirga sp. 57AJ16]|uniref:leucine-rich repeat protein n=1 Tax=Flavivirga sp. 57AJ16 TaxID=3025307 RepID=UPI002365CDB5|nr:leucine-rich repeat protein [Flavivirga sp. 57AJ16]MDD7888307.1 leucine-rich repeat protein [Flavivirga sp. 57AJ16]